MSGLAIVGVGNVLFGDEGVGVEAVLLAMKKGLPCGVEGFPIGVHVEYLFDLMVDFPRVIIIDAVMAGGSPGDIYIFPASDLDRGGRYAIPISMHSLGIPEIINLARIAGSSTEAIIAGVEPAHFNPGAGLSPNVQKALPRILARITALATRNTGM